jgi:biotin operon repressor
MLYLHPEQDFSVSELARALGASFPAVHHEVSRLVGSGFAVDSRRGQARLVRAATDVLFARPLTDLLAVTPEG